jgi:ribosomal protein S27E
MTQQVIEIEEEMLSKHCNLPCNDCGEDTRHILSRNKEFYSCIECGSIVDIEIIEKETKQ